jgi:non-homologous end joining protein Ku
MRKLTSDDQQVAFDSEEVLTRLASVKIDQELLDIEKQIVDQATKPLTDVGYKDMRVAMEEELIEKVLSGEQPTPIAPKLQEQKVENEKDRLKRLLAAKN